MTDTSHLTVSTPTDRDIALSATFDAPRTHVFDALTTPELIRQWLRGPKGWVMTGCEMNAVVGGSYRFVWRNEADGSELVASGDFHDIVPGEKLVRNQVYDDAGDNEEVLITTVLDQQETRTTLTMTLLYPSRAIRDDILKSPLAEGVGESFEKLAELLKILE